MAFIRQVLAAILLLALICQSFSKMIIVVDFYANQDLIARTLCINRLNTAIHCCGKCQLNKRMKQEEHRESESPERRSDHGYEVMSSRSYYLTHIVCIRWFVSLPYSPGFEGMPIDMPPTHFHPPSC